MSLIVPPRFQEDINVVSGYLAHGTKFAKKSLKGLFRAPENEKYVSEKLYELVSNPQFVADSIGGYIHRMDWKDQRGGDAVTVRGVEPEMYKNKIDPKHTQLAQMFSQHRRFITGAVSELLYSYPIPYDEELTNSNPIQQLDMLNRKFLTETGQTIAQNPGVVVPDHEYINPETGVVDDEEYAYGPDSYADGVWRPEKLFTNSRRNRDNPYWSLLKVEFANGLDARGPGNRYKHTADGLDQRGIYEEDVNNAAKYTQGRHLADESLLFNEHVLPPDSEILYAETTDKGFLDVQSTKAENLSTVGSRRRRRGNGRRMQYSRGGQFPHWQVTPHHRNYQWDNSEGLREGGRSDRRSQHGTHGYDMRALTNRSSVTKQNVPMDKQYY